ncbi:MAG: sialidase family protein, partial [bacterium]
MKHAVLLFLTLVAVAFADPPWSAAVKAADVGDTINEGESAIAFDDDYVYCVSNCAERSRVSVIPYGRSTDGGATWTTTWWRDPSGPATWLSDPVIITDDTGYVHLFVQFSTNLIRHYLSTDHGLTWIDTSDVSVPGVTVDKPWACHYGNTIYICWQQLSTPTGIMLARSSDGGRTWTRAIIDTRLYITGIDVSPSGILYVCLRTSGGGLYFFKSTDGGNTWPTDLKRTLDTQCQYTSGWGDRAPMPCIAAPTDDNVVVTIVDQRYGNWDVLYTRSTDAGNTWSALAQLPDSTAGAQCKGWLEADCYGGLHSLWYHTPSWPTSNSSRWSVRYRYSSDFGATWRPSIRLNDTTFTSPVDFMGEYHIMQSDSTWLRCVWADGREGDLDLWYSQARLDAIGVTEKPRG